MIVQLEVLAFTTQGSGAWYDFMLNIKMHNFTKWEPPYMQYQ